MVRQIDHDASAHRWGRELLAPETAPCPDLLDRPILAEVGTDHPVTCDQVAGALASGMSHHVVRDGALREATLGVVETFRLEGKWLPTFAIGLASAQPKRESRSIEGCLSYCPLFPRPAMLVVADARQERLAEPHGQLRQGRRKSRHVHDV